jgi:hypothetical protein
MANRRNISKLVANFLRRATGLRAGKKFNAEAQRFDNQKSREKFSKQKLRASAIQKAAIDFFKNPADR